MSIITWCESWYGWLSLHVILEIPPFCLGLTIVEIWRKKVVASYMLCTEKASNSDIEVIDDNDNETKKLELSVSKGKEKKRCQILSPSSCYKNKLLQEITQRTFSPYSIEILSDCL